MKNSKRFLMAIFGLLVFSAFGCEKEKIISESELPTSIKIYLETHFPSCGIIRIVKEKEDNKPSFDIDLDCGINIEFYANGQVIDIDGTSKLPDSVIPDKILDYTTTNYPDDFIIGWELEGNNQQVELNTIVVLEFDSDGNFLRTVD
ncbi:PepSY-like domain-containing protein [Gelidibacter maritimus]|uniref:PepSY-like domain-containing protein n=1 Tax=Gelidibacter maritimus TaxID=2761487 RepID=A0A7W2M902_9FLAO|nr:PepSY-like domain-containing protein [Gelidibacter maritimus]MBA6154868.1 PepSY-like domain-containing protein [Gelidibacter maritimus]